MAQAGGQALQVWSFFFLFVSFKIKLWLLDINKQIWKEKKKLSISDA